MSHNLASTWVKTQCPDSRVQDDLLNHVEHTARLGANCSALVGAALTRNGKRYLVHCYSDELFVFELTPAQAQRLEVRDDMVVRILGRSREAPASLPLSLFFKEVVIDNADSLSRHEPVTGRYSYETLWNYPVACMVRLDYELPDTRWVFFWHYPAHDLPPAGTFTFSFPAFCDRKDPLTESYVGPIAFFVKVFARITPGDPHRAVAISDTRAALVNIT